ncbi:MAG: hypothetical protein MJZ34_06935 [Paludibacteraceae bacterium]|nr:hypothetical protein [Paludibacteraceae bacterium]
MPEFNDIFNSTMTMLNIPQGSFNEKYAKPIDELASLLEKEGIEFFSRNIHDGKQLLFSWCGGDVVCHSGSYGSGGGLLEVMGDMLLTKKESSVDSVLGYLSVNDVFKRVKKAWKKTNAKQD